VIATVQFQHGNVAAKAVFDGLAWTTPDSMMARSLALFLAMADRSPARGDWARWHAQDVANRLQGTVEFDSEPDEHAGRIY
jgi:hypothetical protein